MFSYLTYFPDDAYLGRDAEMWFCVSCARYLGKDKEECDSEFIIFLRKSWEIYDALAEPVGV